MLIEITERNRKFQTGPDYRWSPVLPQMSAEWLLRSKRDRTTKDVIPECLRNVITAFPTCDGPGRPLTAMPTAPYARELKKTPGMF